MTSFLVLGVGPIGGIVGGRLLRAGHDVTFADVDATTLDALQHRGLHIDVPEGDFLLSVTAKHPDELRGSFDVILLAVPSSATESALPVVRRLAAPGTITVSLQNGLVAADIASALGPTNTAGCAIRMGSKRIAPGHVATGVAGHLSLGHWREQPTAALLRLIETLNSAMETELSADIEAELWSKLCHTSMVYFECLEDASLVELLRDPAKRKLFLGLLAEVVATAEASGLRLPAMADFAPDDFSPRHPPADREAAVSAWMQRMDPTSRKGAFRRLREGGRTDVDQVLGVIAAEGASREVSTPICTALQSLVHELEGGAPMSSRNYRQLARIVSG